MTTEVVDGVVHAVVDGLAIPIVFGEAAPSRIIRLERILAVLEALAMPEGTFLSESEIAGIENAVTLAVDGYLSRTGDDDTISSVFVNAQEGTYRQFEGHARAALNGIFSREDEDVAMEKAQSILNTMEAAVDNPDLSERLKAFGIFRRDGLSIHGLPISIEPDA